MDEEQELTPVAKAIRGDGGGGEQYTPRKDPNTLSTSTTAKVLFLISDGECGGFPDRVNPLKNVYLNNDTVMKADGSKKPGILEPFEALGTPSQPVAKGYPSASTTFTLAQTVTTTTPASYTAATTDVDSIRVTIRFPQLLETTDKGDEIGTSVEFQILTNVNGGPYSLQREVTVADKCISPADIDYLITKVGTGLMGVQVVRITADSAVSSKRNDIIFQFATEIKNVQLAYPNRAYVGLTLTTETTGQNYPTVSFDWVGLKIKVPSNYNAAGVGPTGKFPGVWDGTFKSAKEVCTNPAWVLFDLLTQRRIDGEGRITARGLGQYCTESDVDIYSFYDAGYECEGLVPNEFATATEPRFTFIDDITDRGKADQVLQNIAASFCATIFTAGNRVKLIMDRARPGFSRLITNSNVEDGVFGYSNTAATTRITAATVNYTDPEQNWTSNPVYYEDTDQVDLVGLNFTEVNQRGCTRRSQALRYAKYCVEKSASNREVVTFTVGPKNAGLIPGWIVKIADEHYAQVTNYGRLAAKTSSSVTFDGLVTIVIGNTFDVVAGDGVTVETRTFTSGGTASAGPFSFSGAAITALVGADLIVTGAISPRPFEIRNVKEVEGMKWAVTALEYDANMYARIDNTPPGPELVFQAPSTIPSAPVGVTFKEGAISIDNVVKFTLMCSWNRPASGQVQNYVFRWRRSSQPWNEVFLTATAYEFQDVVAGIYEVQVFARSAFGNLSPASEASYTLAINGVDPSNLFAPTDLGEYATGGAIFAEEDLNVKFTNPAGNEGRGALRDFEVRVINPADSAVMRTEYVLAVPPGTTQSYIYSYEANVQDFAGSPKRSIRIEVRCRDANYNLSDEIARTFNNPPPAIPTNIEVSGGFGAVKITWDLPPDPDAAGVIIWSSTDPNFAPSDLNWIYDGGDTYAVDLVKDIEKHYYRFAAYDSFNKNYNGTGLNVTTTFMAAAVNPDIDANKLVNSTFERKVEAPAEGDPPADLGRPIGFEQFTPDGSGVWTDPAGFNSTKAFGLKFTTSSYHTVGEDPTHIPGQLIADGMIGFGGGFGLQTHNASYVGGGIVGGWKDNTDYLISFYAKKVNGAAWTGMKLSWGDVPIGVYSPIGTSGEWRPTAPYYVWGLGTGVEEELLNPTLTTTYQRYLFHIKFDVTGSGRPLPQWNEATGGHAIGDPDGSLRISVVGDTEPDDEIHIDNIQVEEGVTDGGYSPRVADLLLPGSITSTLIEDNAVTTPKLVTNAVVAGKVAAFAISSINLQSQSVTADKVDVSRLDAITGNFGSPTSSTDAGAWNAATNTPTLDQRYGTQGQYYTVSVGGTTILGSTNLWVPGDVAYFSGASWSKLGSAPAAVVPGGINAGYVHGTVISGGDFTHVIDWPAPGGTGFQLSAAGFLLGNYNDGEYAHLTPAGVFPAFTKDEDDNPIGVEIANGNATFSGALSAATGTFAGALTAASGTFAGDITAATGTFSGTVNIQDASVTTLKIAGRAVTLPGSAYEPGNSAVAYMWIPPDAMGARTWIVPAGITSLDVTSIGGGGGGGGTWHSGDSHGGGAGGAGGVNTATISVTPGEKIYIVVGQSGGAAGTVNWGSCVGNRTINGGNGRSSYITRGDAPDVRLVEATGGYGGNGAVGDNAAPADGNHTNGGSGNSGTPGSVSNPAAPPGPRNDYVKATGASNGTGFGIGGNGNGSVPYSCPTAGSNGRIAFTWTGGSTSWTAIALNDPTQTVAIINGSVATPRSGYSQQLLIHRPSMGVGIWETVRSESVAGGTVPALMYQAVIDEPGDWAFQTYSTDTEQGARAFVSALLTLR